MSPVKISWKNLRANKLTFFLNVLLICFGTGILTLLLLSSVQVGEKLSKNAKGIDLVVGAKGSPLQLILSSIYFIDFPTGNIPLSQAEELARNPMVSRAIPLALGDNYQGFRIVGTDSSFVNLHDLQLASGKFWAEDFEVVVGAEVARTGNLKVGDKLYGSHGLSSSQDIHAEHAYILKGILNSTGNTVDNLVLTSMESIWKMHGSEDENHHQEKEITSILIQYRSRMAMVLLPPMINKSTSMQAASPAKESARLFSLIGIGVETLQWFATAIMLMAGVSVFVSLYNSMRERKYDLAVMRVLGASAGKLFCIIILEGIILTTIGSLTGLWLGHTGMELIGHFQESAQVRLTGFIILTEELYLLATAALIGFVAAVFPAIQAYRTDISSTLTKG
ncbi:MAG TPA: FtsX-like permease family protein [Dyadobacter sp.]|nr:FtsX-like permease family protein [Dyadobacter sp.]